MNPISRSKKKLEADGYMVAIVEKFVPFPKPGHRVDLFGMFDLLAVREDTVIGVQVTSASHVAERVHKLLSNPNLGRWSNALGRHAAVHGWAKRGERGKRKLWACKEVVVIPVGEGTAPQRLHD